MRYLRGTAETTNYGRRMVMLLLATVIPTMVEILQFVDPQGVLCRATRLVRSCSKLPKFPTLPFRRVSGRKSSLTFHFRFFTITSSRTLFSRSEVRHFHFFFYDLLTVYILRYANIV
ncbi:hypothetical protein AVEN_31884-1 [Araneus ventricosus]|uniref:Uncharacterized protein n=1 Tax=Araneus ventricosus TaxID=182803 RepID=A0A4Y2TXY0_ARAVE|nr:hypothetical protein AVEN_31884-1 [Araneus ventricosus]